MIAASASASRLSPNSAKKRCDRRSARRAWMRSSFPPTTISSMRSCASPTCASGAASSLAAQACRAIWRRMAFLWPEFLWLLLAVPALIGLYFLLLRRKKKQMLRYANLAMVRDAISAGQRFRRHIPALLFLLALTALVVAVARPTATLTLPSQHEIIILAMDVSGSMRAADVEPNRIGAAQAAARAFVADQPASARIGVVSFAATASVVQPPTRNRDDILAAIDRFQLQRGTAVGSG